MGINRHKHIVLLLLVLVISVSLAACSANGDNNTGTDNTVLDTSWQRVRDNGKLVVGLCAAYPQTLRAGLSVCSWVREVSRLPIK